jgi:hypothetical protein
MGRPRHLHAVAGARGARRANPDPVSRGQGLHDGEMVDLTGQHSNPPDPLSALLEWAATAYQGGDAKPRAPSRAADNLLDGRVAATHRRHDWVVAAVVSVLQMQTEPIRARDVHLAVEGSLGMVRWASEKACLASNVGGQSPRFVRVGRGRYRLAS